VGGRRALKPALGAGFGVFLSKGDARDALTLGLLWIHRAILRCAYESVKFRACFVEEE
jgi:hypothetical protein